MKMINEFYQKAENMKTRLPLVEGGAEWLMNVIGNDKEHSVWVVASEAPFSSDVPFTLIFERNDNNLLGVVGYDADWSLWEFDLSNDDVYPNEFMIKWLNKNDMSFDEAKQYNGCCFEAAYKLLSEFMSCTKDDWSYNIHQSPSESTPDFMFRVMANIGGLKDTCLSCEGICSCSTCGRPLNYMDEIYYPERESYDESLDMYLLGYK